MEVLFENCYTRTPAIHKEIYRRYLITSPLQIVTNILAVLVLLLFSALNILRMILGEPFRFGGYIFVALLFLVREAMYIFTYKTAIKRDYEMNQGQPLECKTVITESGMQFITSGSEITVELSAIKKVIKTRNLILLHTKANLVYALIDNGFTVGSKDEFIQFLKNKGFKIK